MLGHLGEMLSSEDFMPHGMCFLWRPDLLWLHATSDTLIALAYYSIPVALIYFVRRRKDLVFPALFILFGVFIFACGTTHLLAVWTIWHPTIGSTVPSRPARPESRLPALSCCGVPCPLPWRCPTVASSRPRTGS